MLSVCKGNLELPDAAITNYHLHQLEKSTANAIIDPDKEEITWASYGPWHGQHDPKVHDDGTVVMFDNKGSFEPGTGGSRVLQADLNSSGIVWRPKNSPPTYNGPIRVRLALAQSKNVVAVRLLREVGLDKTIGHLSSFGFAPDELPFNDSLALGSASLTPLEVATGFSTFANGGYLINPFLIDRIEDSFGNVLFQHNPAWACEN